MAIEDFNSALSHQEDTRAMCRTEISNNPHLSSTLYVKRFVLYLGLTFFLFQPVALSNHRVQRFLNAGQINQQRRRGTGTASIIKTRRRFLEMFARSYFPGRSGQLLIVPREGDFITRADPNVAYMHGSPWPYDVSIPLLFVGPAVKQGRYSRSAKQQDVAPTLAAALGAYMPPTTIGSVLPIFKSDFVKPRAIFLLVLDGMRRDYFDRYASSMPTLIGLRRRAAWFSRAEVNFLPTNTAAGHASISTGTDPSIHGISGVSFYDHVRRRQHNVFAEATTEDLMALTLCDVWQFATSGRAVILVQGSIDRAAIPLAGHGRCQINGTPVVMASYDQQTGHWTTNPNCFRLPPYLRDLTAEALWPANGDWMGHKVDSTANVRYSGLFPAFEADAMVAMIEHEPIGLDNIPDLILMNFKGADFVGHKHGPDSKEIQATLAEMDRLLARILRTLETKVGTNYLLAITADHGMPAKSSSDQRHFAQSIVNLLHDRFDSQARQLIRSFEPENAQIFVDEERLSTLGLTLRNLGDYLESQPFIFAVFTNDEVRNAAPTVNDGLSKGAQK